MLGIKKALEAFKAFPQDPYVVLDDGLTELRFNEKGEIVGAYKADPPKSLRWYSAEFKALLAAGPGLGFIV